MELINSIISKCLEGDEEACLNLYNRFMPYCYGICIRYGIHKNEIKDQIQIIFSASFNSLHSFDANKASFKTWFSKICVNKILANKRNKKRRPSFDSLSDSHYEIQTITNFDEPIDKDYIFHILNKMPKKYLIVFNMYIIDGYSHKEIANTLKISEGASRIMLKRGRDWAKISLKNLYEMV